MYFAIFAHASMRHELTGIVENICSVTLSHIDPAHAGDICIYVEPKEGYTLDEFESEVRRETDKKGSLWLSFEQVHI